MPNDTLRGATARLDNPTPAMAAARFQVGDGRKRGPGRKGIEAHVRWLLESRGDGNDVDAILHGLADIALGRMPPGITAESSVKMKDRIEAAKVLLDRGWGKARAVVDITHEVETKGLGAIDVDALDVDGVEMLERAVQGALAKAGASALPPGDPVDAELVSADSE